MKAAQCPSTDEWIKKMWYRHTMECYSAIKRTKLAICNNVDGTRQSYAKERKSIRQKQMPYDLGHTWNLRNKQTNKQAKGKKRERQANQETDS